MAGIDERITVTAAEARVAGGPRIPRSEPNLTPTDCGNLDGSHWPRCSVGSGWIESAARARHTRKSYRADVMRWEDESGATRKLTVLDAAQTLEFLKTPPGNRLEPLTGDRDDQHSIRSNDQFRICFRWTSEGPTDAEIVEYHEG